MYNFKEMTVEQLKEFLNENKVAFRSNASKETLISVAEEFYVEFSSQESDSDDSLEEDSGGSDDSSDSESGNSENENPQPEIERKFYAAEVVGSKSFPLKIRIKNNTPSNHVFPEIQSVDGKDSVLPAFSDWREFIVDNDGQAIILESNLIFLSNMQKWDDNRNIQIAAVKEKD